MSTDCRVTDRSSSTSRPPHLAASQVTNKLRAALDERYERMLIAARDLDDDLAIAELTR
jgi:hypothetical protein